MKKTISLLLCVLLLLGMWTGLTSAAFAEGFSAAGSVLFEKDGLKVTTAGLDTDPTSDEQEPIIWLDIENAGAQDVCLGVTEGSVNGIMCDLWLIDFYVEDGAYFGGNYSFDLVIPAGSSGRYALGCQKLPSIGARTVSELSFCFTLAEDAFTWPDYSSDPVTIVTGLPAEPVDFASLGTVVLDNEELTLVIGEQDYEDWIGPEIVLYLVNKSGQYLGLTADSAAADGVSCGDGDIYFSTAAAPGKCTAALMAFGSPIAELKGIEDLTLTFDLYRGETRDVLDGAPAVRLDPVTVQFPPRIWGEYENGGLTLEILPKYNDLVTVETPEDGVLFTVSETASLEAGGYEGAGWLFSIGKADADRLHELLGQDMSGVYAFAKDDAGMYYLCYHPTDVRYERATPKEMARDQEQWSMLTAWVEQEINRFADQNGLQYVSFGNSPVDMLLARAAWGDEKAVLSTAEYGPADAKGADGTDTAEFAIRSSFEEVGPADTPEGEYVTLSLPQEDAHLDFFFAPGGYVRLVQGGLEWLYQAFWYDDTVSPAEAMQSWYYAAAEKAGLREHDGAADAFTGLWREKIAGRGEVNIEKSLAWNKVKITARWPESASTEHVWEMTAVLQEDGSLAYQHGTHEVMEYDETGMGSSVDFDWDVSGRFYPGADGELCWHDDLALRPEDSVFVRAD